MANVDTTNTSQFAATVPIMFKNKVLLFHNWFYELKLEIINDNLIHRRIWMFNRLYEGQ